MNTSPMTLVSDTPCEVVSGNAKKNTNEFKSESSSPSHGSFAHVLAQETHTRDPNTAWENNTKTDGEDEGPVQVEGQKIAASNDGLSNTGSALDGAGAGPLGLVLPVANLKPLDAHASGSLISTVATLGIQAPPAASAPAGKTMVGLVHLDLPLAEPPTPSQPGQPGAPVAWMDTKVIPWVATPLGHGLTIISPPQEPGVESLNTFALSQGLDPATVKWLLSGQRQGEALTSDDPTVAMPKGLAGMLAGTVPWSPQTSPMESTPMRNGGPTQSTATTLDVSQALGDEGADWLKSLGWLKTSRADGLTANPEGSKSLDTLLPSEALTSVDAANATQGYQPDSGGHPPSSGQGHSAGLGGASKGEWTTRQNAPESLGLPSGMLSGQELAEKMNEAIGKRLLQAVERGDWQLKLQLKPAELGHIDVDLRVKGHVLEAQFTTHQALTRDLLEAGSGRLKETLAQSGMDVASMKFNDGQSARFGGDSTPRQSSSGNPKTGQGPSEPEVQPDRLSTASHVNTARPGGLDLMV